MAVVAASALPNRGTASGAGRSGGAGRTTAGDVRRGGPRECNSGSPFTTCAAKATEAGARRRRDGGRFATHDVTSPATGSGCGGCRRAGRTHPTARRHRRARRATRAGSACEKPGQRYAVCESGGGAQLLHPEGEEWLSVPVRPTPICNSAAPCTTRRRSRTRAGRSSWRLAQMNQRASSRRGRTTSRAGPSLSTAQTAHHETSERKRVIARERPSWLDGARANAPRVRLMGARTDERMHVCGRASDRRRPRARMPGSRRSRRRERAAKRRRATGGRIQRSDSAASKCASTPRCTPLRVFGRASRCLRYHNGFAAKRGGLNRARLRTSFRRVRARYDPLDALRRRSGGPSPRGGLRVLGQPRDADRRRDRRFERAAGRSDNGRDRRGRCGRAVGCLDRCVRRSRRCRDLDSVQRRRPLLDVRGRNALSLRRRSAASASSDGRGVLRASRREPRDRQ